MSVDTVSITKVCGHVSGSNPPPVASYLRQRGRRPKVQLRCPPSKNISNILFASFGSPLGDCSSYAAGSCHSTSSSAVVERVSVFLYKFALFISREESVDTSSAMTGLFREEEVLSALVV